MTPFELFTQSTGLAGQVINKFSTEQGRKQFRENFGSFAKSVATFDNGKEHMGNMWISCVANLMIIVAAQLIAYNITDGSTNGINWIHAILACCCAPCYLLWAVLSVNGLYEGNPLNRLPAYTQEAPKVAPKV